MNNRRDFLQKLFITGTGLALGAVPKSAYARDEFIHLTVLHTNDLHCQIDPFPYTHPQHGGKGGFARLSALVKEQRRQNSNILLVDAGDMYQGTPYFNYYGGELIFSAMSLMGYDAGTLGNHEFDNGLSGLEEHVHHAEFPFINSNYDFSGTLLNRYFPSFQIIRKGGLRIGIYGLGIRLDGLVNSQQQGGVRYNEPIDVALRMESMLRNDRKCDLVICLSHLGHEYADSRISDKIIASETRFTDLIIGGHTHTFLDRAAEMRNADGRPVWVNQAGWGTLMLGKIDLIFDRSSRRMETVLSHNIL